MPRPVLPLGTKAPWILAGIALFLAASGFLTGNRDMMIVGGVAATLWVLAFPLSRLLIGRDTPEQEVEHHGSSDDSDG